MLYEDEMADNGITMLSCKVRVMPQRMLLLCRFFMRLVNVLVRLRDTRLYVDFGNGEVTREFHAKEEKYETVRQVGSCPIKTAACHVLTCCRDLLLLDKTLRRNCVTRII